MYSRNWTSYCNAKELSVDHEPERMCDFIIWIRNKSCEFRRINNFDSNTAIGHMEKWIEFLERS